MPKADIGFSRLAFGEQGGFGKRRPALMNAMLEKERSAVQGVMMRSLSDAAFRERERMEVMCTVEVETGWGAWAHYRRDKAKFKLEGFYLLWPRFSHDMSDCSFPLPWLGPGPGKRVAELSCPTLGGG